MSWNNGGPNPWGTPGGRSGDDQPSSDPNRPDGERPRPNGDRSDGKPDATRPASGPRWAGGRADGERPDRGRRGGAAGDPAPDNPWGDAGRNDRTGPRRADNPSRGSGAGPRGPFGGRPFGGGGSPFGGQGPIPELDRLIAQAQAYVRRMFPGGGGRSPRGPTGGFFGSGRGIAFLGLAVVALWLASGIYRVQPDEQGVVLRFGAVNRTSLPGLNYHLPWPIERVIRPAVTRINRTEIGYRSVVNGAIDSGRDRSGRDILAESLMLTGDENIIDIDVAVFWRIRDAEAYLFNTRRPDDLVRAVTESSLREVIGRIPIQPALTEARAQIETDVLRQSQEILDRYGTGVEVTQVQLQKVDPPQAVIESFRDVQRANTDADRLRNEAESYRNDIVPRARGEAARLVAEAQGARQSSIAQATGQAQRFDSVLRAYQGAREVTVQRMYLDTMQDIMSNSQALVIDDKLRGVVPFLPLNVPGPNPPTGAAPNVPPAPGPRTSPAPQPQTGASR